MKIAPFLPIPKGQKGTRLKDWSRLPWSDLAEAVKNNIGGNLGVRLDNLFALDPDCPEAEKFCNELEAKGELPPTVAYRTASGFTGRIFSPPLCKPKNGRTWAPLKIDSPMKLEVRTGAGQYIVIPPSYVEKTRTGKPGTYEWLPGHSPDDIKIADFPVELHERLKKLAAAPQAAPGKGTTHTPGPRTLSFEE